MPDAVPVLVIILIAAWLPGRLALQRLRGQELRFIERHFAALGLGLALCGWLAFTLAELGLFSLPLLAILWLSVTLLLTLLAYTATPPHPHSSTPPHPHTRSPLHLITEPLLLALWLPAALWLFLRPHEAILGAADAGVYVSTAAHIAREGQILVYDAALAQLDTTLRAVLLRPIPDAAVAPSYLFPGFNVVDAGAGTILPDFFHYHPTWQAVAYTLGERFAGPALAVRAALLMPGMWALLGAVAVYLTLRQALQRPGAGERGVLGATLVAGIALVALSLNAIQVWFARYPVTETLTQMLLWTGLWALGAWLMDRHPLRLWGLLAGLSFGLVLLTRIDALAVLAIPVLTAVWQLARRDLCRVHLWYYVPLALLTVHLGLHSAFISRPYFARITGYVQGLATRFWPLLVTLVAVGLLAVWLLGRYRKLSQVSELWPGRLRPFLALVVLSIIGLAVYGWFIRPVYGALPSYTEWYDGQTIVLTDRENLVRLGWYLGPLGVWLGVAGICLLIWKINRRSIAFLGLGLFFSLLYLWRIQANPHQIYVMRRYVPVVLPFFIAGGAALIHYLVFGLWARREGTSVHADHTASQTSLQRNTVIAARVLGLLLALAWLATIAWSARGFVTQVDYRGLTAQLAQLDRQLPQNSVLIFDEQAPIGRGDILGTPLRFLFGHDVFTLRAPQQLDNALLVRTIESWQNSGRSVYWVGAADWLQTQDLNYTTEEVTITTSALEGSYEHKPYRILPLTWTLNLKLIESP